VGFHRVRCFKCCFVFSSSGKVFEKEFTQSISLIEDPQNKVSVPIGLKGGVPVESSDGTVLKFAIAKPYVDAANPRTSPSATALT